jgi:hypothetical protein
MQRAWSIAGSTVLFQVPKRLRLLVLLLLVSLAHITMFASVLPLAWRGASLFYILSVPGFLLAQAMFRQAEGWASRILLGIASALAIQTLLIWLAHAPVGPITPIKLLLPANALTLICALFLFPQQHEKAIRFNFGWRNISLFIVLGVAAFFRFRFLGNAEFQGDEANVVLLAVDSVIGHEAILFLHRKGPAEVLLSVPPLALFGVTNEWLGRLPFAISSLGVVYASYVVARKMLRHLLGEPTATIAGLVTASILSLDGFLIAFARMVQYQNLVVLMMIGAFWCGWRFYVKRTYALQYLLAGATFAAIALLSHYDGAAVLPVLGWFILAGALRHQRLGSKLVKLLIAPLAWFSALVLSFYIPFVLNPQFQSTLSNLQKRTGQRDQVIDLYNNLPFYEKISTFYNTTFQIHWLAAVLVVAGFAWLAYYARPRWLGIVLTAIWGFGWFMQVRNADWFAFGDFTNGALFFLSVPLIVLAFLPKTPVALKALLIWFLVPFSAESFLITDPKTHFYTMDAALALLLGLAAAQALLVLRSVKLSWLRPATALPALALLSLAIPHQYLVFIRQVPEYRIVFPAARPDIYKASYGDVLPRNAGYFGFPHRAGWRVIGELYRNGTLNGNYESNEDYYITLWYIGRTTRCGHTPEYYFLAKSPLDYTKVPTEYIQSEYHRFGKVLVDGHEQIEIYSRQAVDSPRIYDSADYIERFDDTAWISLPDEQKNYDLDPIALEQAVLWGDQLTLNSTKLRSLDMVAGQTTNLTLQLQAHQAFTADDQLLLELRDAQGNVVKNITGACYTMPIDFWHTQENITATFPVAADGEIPVGEYQLYLSLRRADGTIVPLSDGQQSYHVADYTVTPLY